MELPDRIREALADRYTLVREIGRGGMAVVYLAQDLRHNRPVALKILVADEAAPHASERFQREIYFAARLQHPHILTVFDSGELGAAAGGSRQLWYTMPFVEGESLRDRLHRMGKIPVDEALRITSEAALALDYAHQQGVVHRDIKPENILLTRDGLTLVADFGIARALDAEDHLTRTGITIGSPLYMSPEQTDGKEVDPRADQYALASVLFEMLSGEVPFTGQTLHAVVAKRIADPTPSVATLNPEIPAAVDDAIRRAMAPERDDRFVTIAEFARALHGPSRPVAARARGQAVPDAPARRRPTSNVLIALLLGILIGGGALFAWRRIAGHAGRTKVIAVLPFENLGDSADAYFADGVADEVRTKLAQVGELEVIARGSSIEYQHPTSGPTEIAQELGADYLLTGTVRWEKGAGTNRVRVTPELVEARQGKAARTRWVQQFDASLTDVFQVQADIATRVANAMGVVLGDSSRRELMVKPTENLVAYDEFLKGEATAGGMKNDQASLRQAITFYESAVALDSTFVQAWSQLSRARSSLYSNGVPVPELGEQARVAAERARQLKPKDPSVFLAIGDYYGSVNPIDNEQSAAAYEDGLRLAPDNVDLLGAAALTEVSLGRWDGAASRLARATLLDPRSANTFRRLATVHAFLQNYPAADSAADRAIALAPTNPTIVLVKVLIALARGDLDSARAVVKRTETQIDPGTLLPFMALYQDLYWVLDDEEQRQVLAAPPSAFDNDRASWGIVRAEIYHLRGDRFHAAIYADSARLAFLEQTRSEPEDGQRRVLLGLSLAYLERKADAVREGLAGVKLIPISQNGLTGPYVQLQMVRIYLLVGEPEKALDQLEPLLKVPFYLSPGWLRIDPTFEPLRENPRFLKFVEGKD
jgi:serine/threonine-protein kinase